MSKTVYGWVANWSEVTKGDQEIKPPNITVDLFFTSRQVFKELLGWSHELAAKEILVPVEVSDDFDDLDYIPRDY